MTDLHRYSRQTLVSQVGLEGQQRLASSRVVIVGVGGLGCLVGAQLAGAGVGRIHLIDHDVVDITNLHRQVLFRETDIGQSKSLTALRELRAINSDIEISATQSRLSISNVGALIEDSLLVIDAADNFATSYLLSDACLAAHIPLLSASVNKSFGYLGTFCGSDTAPAPSLRAVFPKLPKEQQSCDTVGVTGPSVGVIASLQAQEAIKLLVGGKDQLLGKLLYADLWNYKMHTMDFSKAQEPCDSQIELITAHQILDSDYVIDVRESHETAAEPQSFETSLCLPLLQFDKRIGEIPESSRLVLACRSGQRALIAAQCLLDHGHISVAAVLPDQE